MPDHRFTAAFSYLLTRVGVRMGEIFARELAGAGLSLQMYRVLAALWERDSQRLTDLADMISSETSTLSRLVGTLSRMNYVMRQRRATDGRSVRISLTPAGRDIASRWIPRAVQFEAAAIEGFDGRELAELKTMLERVYDNLSRIEMPRPEPMRAGPNETKAIIRSHVPLRTPRAHKKS